MTQVRCNNCGDNREWNDLDLDLEIISDDHNPQGHLAIRVHIDTHRIYPTKTCINSDLEIFCKEEFLEFIFATARETLKNQECGDYLYDDALIFFSTDVSFRLDGNAEFDYQVPRCEKYNPSCFLKVKTL